MVYPLLLTIVLLATGGSKQLVSVVCMIFMRELNFTSRVSCLALLMFHSYLPTRHFCWTASSLQTLMRKAPHHLQILYNIRRSRNMRPGKVVRQTMLSRLHLLNSRCCPSCLTTIRCVVVYRRHACQSCSSLYFFVFFAADAGCHPK